MNLDSKALPLLVGLAVAGLAVLLMFGGGLFEPDAPGEAAPPVAEAPPPLHPRQVEARTAIREGRFEEARGLLAEIGPEDPAFASSLADRAVLHETTGQYELALAISGQLLMIEPENPLGHLVMARTLLGLGDDAQAEAACLRSLEIDPANISARYTVGLIRLARGRADRAIDAYLRAMRYGPDRVHVDEALADLTRLEQRRPDLAEVHYAMAFFANSLGARDHEILELERYLATDPTGPVADSARARLALLK